MGDFAEAVRYAVPAALVGGLVWYVVASWRADPDWAQGAAFVVVFGLVVALGWYYSDDGDDEDDE